MFSIGGTRDSLVGLVRGTGDKTCLYVLVRQSLDLDEVKDKVTQTNSLRAAFSGSPETCSIAILGLQKAASEEELKTLREIQPNIIEVSTAQEGKAVSSLQRLISETKAEIIVLSISLEAILGVPGVSKPCQEGISTEDAVGLCIAAAGSSKVVAIDICDYNPYIEDWQTGRLVATMFYYLTLGLSARL